MKNLKLNDRVKFLKFDCVVCSFTTEKVVLFNLYTRSYMTVNLTNITRE